MPPSYNIRLARWLQMVDPHRLAVARSAEDYECPWVVDCLGRERYNQMVELNGQAGCWG